MTKHAWTVVVWAVVAPDLVEAIEADLKEAQIAVEAFGDVDVHVHVVRTGPALASPMIWSSPVEADGQADASAAPTLGEVLEGASCWTGGGRKRLLILWGHGARAFSVAAPGPDVLSAAQVAGTFDSPQLRALPPDIVGYDACRMASLSTVLSLAEQIPTSLFVGSMAPEPASGWPYVQLLRILREGWDPPAVAAAIVEAYAASVDVDDWCLVALELAGVARAPDGLATALTALRATAAPRAVDFFAAAEGADILDDTDLVDLGALMRRLKLQKPNAAAQRVLDALTGATIARRAHGGLSGRDGLAILVGTPWVNAAWPPQPGWADYFPEPEQAEV